MRDISLSWREAVTKLLYACCYGAADAAADFQIKALVDFFGVAAQSDGINLKLGLLVELQEKV